MTQISTLSGREFPNANNNAAYIKLSWAGFHRELGKQNKSIPHDMDLILLGLDVQNKLMNNSFAVYSLCPNNLAHRGVYHSGEGAGQERIYANEGEHTSFEDIYIDFNQLGQERFLQSVVVLVLSNTVELTDGTAFRSPLNQVPDLKIDISTSGSQYTGPQTFSLSRMDGITPLQGKYAMVYGVFDVIDRTTDANGVEQKRWGFTPLMDTDIKNPTLAGILNSYGAVGVSG